MSLARVSNSLGLTNWDFKKLCTFWYDPVGILKNPKFEIVGSRWVGVNNISSFLFSGEGRTSWVLNVFRNLAFSSHPFASIAHMYNYMAVCNCYLNTTFNTSLYFDQFKLKCPFRQYFFLKYRTRETKENTIKSRREFNLVIFFFLSGWILVHVLGKWVPAFCYTTFRLDLIYASFNSVFACWIFLLFVCSVVRYF